MADFQRPPTAQEAVLVELRARILRGDIAPGAPVRQEDLAESLGVSRVPVREALRMLESEGHVTYLPHRGYRVAELDLDELEEIYHLRALIEDDLARRALARRAPDHVDSVRTAHARLAAAEAAAPPDPTSMAAANRAFHWAVLRPTPRAERILTTLWDASEVYRARWFAHSDNVARGAHEHTRALAAIEAGDADALVAVLAEHRAGAVGALRAQLSRAATPPARSASAEVG
jgi:DNA-binding GntR family transcriptional regulator